MLNRNSRRLAASVVACAGVGVLAAALTAQAPVALPDLFRQATGVDTRPIVEKWVAPVQ